MYQQGGEMQEPQAPPQEMSPEMQQMAAKAEQMSVEELQALIQQVQAAMQQDPSKAAQYQEVLAVLMQVAEAKAAQAPEQQQAQAPMPGQEMMASPEAMPSPEEQAMMEQQAMQQQGMMRRGGNVHRYQSGTAEAYYNKAKDIANATGRRLGDFYNRQMSYGSGLGIGAAPLLRAAYQMIPGMPTAGTATMLPYTAMYDTAMGLGKAYNMYNPRTPNNPDPLWDPEMGEHTRPYRGGGNMPRYQMGPADRPKPPIAPTPDTSRIRVPMAPRVSDPTLRGRLINTPRTSADYLGEAEIYPAPSRYPGGTHQYGGPLYDMSAQELRAGMGFPAAGTVEPDQSSIYRCGGMMMPVPSRASAAPYRRGGRMYQVGGRVAFPTYRDMLINNMPK
jgi:hypothetical protein